MHRIRCKNRMKWVSCPISLNPFCTDDDSNVTENEDVWIQMIGVVLMSVIFRFQNTVQI